MRLKVRLLGVTPMVWRRLEVPTATTLQEVHGVIQVAMGWEGVHLFLFELRAADYGHHMVASRSAAVTLDALALRRGEKLRYVYDMGDYWEHELRVEGFSEPSASARYPRCVGGSGTCPPEDCGGPHGYSARREEAVGYEALCDVEDMVETVREILAAEPERPIRKDDPRFNDLVATVERLEVRARFLETRFSRAEVNERLGRGDHLDLQHQHF